MSRESIRQILYDAWKASTDPQFIEKMHRILELCDHPPADGPAR